jgi:hypothetical protein
MVFHGKLIPLSSKKRPFGRLNWFCLLPCSGKWEFKPEASGIAGRSLELPRLGVTEAGLIDFIHRFRMTNLHSRVGKHSRESFDNFGRVILSENINKERNGLFHKCLSVAFLMIGQSGSLRKA